MNEIKRYKIEVTGIVQGVGFRPFVYRLAKEHLLAGYVLNHDRGVTIEVEGKADSLIPFMSKLSSRAPHAAKITSIRNLEIDVLGEQNFLIKESYRTGEKAPDISPDLALCSDCRTELFDPADRRYFYPFINCTNCGPRFTIIKDVPYDRAATTMSVFEMCEDCKSEYNDPLNRRFHAQPNACPKCGPNVSLLSNDLKPLLKTESSKALIQKSAELLKDGKILALKGLGGFHLACDALNPSAVINLRSRKVREDKPFAIMFSDICSLEKFCLVSQNERTVLMSTEKPIVLLQKKSNPEPTQKIAEEVAPQNRFLGAILPYTPLHELLLQTFGGPLVMTSGNMSDEPIAFLDEDAFRRLGGIADYFLIHNREIHVRCDDSVVDVQNGGLSFYRRSRGYAPLSVRLANRTKKSILGVGAHLKNTFCLAKNDNAFISHHIGDLENLSTLEAFEKGIIHFQNLFNIVPEIVAHDLHSEYLSTKWVKDKFSNSPNVFAVQHHHAHIAACLEDNEYDGPVIGIALDGTGLGTDGTIWGGEILVADKVNFLRVGHLRQALIPGGESAIKDPWKLALAYAHASGASDLELPHVPKEKTRVVQTLLEQKLNCYKTTSAGRLFDAVSAIIGITNHANYEGQPAIELERALHLYLSERTAESYYCYDFTLDRKADGFELDWAPTIKEIIKDVNSGTAPGKISVGFHNSLTKALVQVCMDVRARKRLNTVALSGGCLMNQYLRTKLCQKLEKEGFKVLFHKKIPTNDGSISFGQVIVANQIAEGNKSCVWQYR